MRPRVVVPAQARYSPALPGISCKSNDSTPFEHAHNSLGITPELSGCGAHFSYRRDKRWRGRAHNSMVTETKVGNSVANMRQTSPETICNTAASIPIRAESREYIHDTASIGQQLTPISSAHKICRVRNGVFARPTRELRGGRIPGRAGSVCRTAREAPIATARYLFVVLEPGTTVARPGMTSCPVLRMIRGVVSLRSGGVVATPPAASGIRAATGSPAADHGTRIPESHAAALQPGTRLRERLEQTSIKG